MGHGDDPPFPTSTDDVAAPDLANMVGLPETLVNLGT